MSVEPLVVAPEDTLGEIAEKMRASDVGSAAVADYGRLIGILTSRDLLKEGGAHEPASIRRATISTFPLGGPGYLPMQRQVRYSILSPR